MEKCPGNWRGQVFFQERLFNSVEQFVKLGGESQIFASLPELIHLGNYADDQYWSYIHTFTEGFERW